MHIEFSKQQFVHFIRTKEAKPFLQSGHSLINLNKINTSKFKPFHSFFGFTYRDFNNFFLKKLPILSSSVIILCRLVLEVVDIFVVFYAAYRGPEKCFCLIQYKSGI